jgi:hypothetical protein
VLNRAENEEARRVASNFSKTIGYVYLGLTPPWPRWLTIRRTDRDDMELSGLTLEQARDLHYALGRLIAQADEEDAKQK